MKQLDLKGLKCPLPVLRLRRFLRDKLTIGEQVQLETTDPMAGIDIPHFCNEYGQALISVDAIETGHVFIVEKKTEVTTDR